MTTSSHAAVEALREAHSKLLEDLQSLEDAIPHSVTGADLGARLIQTQQDVLDHFAREELNGGYMDTVRQREPRLERAVRRLGDDHRLLAEQISGLVARATASSRNDSTLGRDIIRWIKDLRRHERCEIDLVQDTFTSDISAED